MTLSWLESASPLPLPPRTNASSGAGWARPAVVTARTPDESARMIRLCPLARGLQGDVIVRGDPRRTELLTVDPFPALVAAHTGCIARCRACERGENKTRCEAQARDCPHGFPFLMRFLLIHVLHILSLMFKKRISSLRSLVSKNTWIFFTHSNGSI